MRLGIKKVKDIDIEIDQTNLNLGNILDSINLWSKIY